MKTWFQFFELRLLCKFVWSCKVVVLRLPMDRFCCMLKAFLFCFVFSFWKICLPECKLHNFIQVFVNKRQKLEMSASQFRHREEFHHDSILLVSIAKLANHSMCSNCQIKSLLFPSKNVTISWNIFPFKSKSGNNGGLNNPVLLINVVFCLCMMPSPGLRLFLFRHKTWASKTWNKSTLRSKFNFLLFYKKVSAPKRHPKHLWTADFLSLVL